MKKIILIALIVIIGKINYAQHILPATYTIEPEKLDSFWYFHNALTADFSGTKNILSNSLPAGFVTNFAHKVRPNRYDRNYILNIDFNPIIIAWDPFKWTNLQSVKMDSFFINKLPFAENAILHIGLRKNKLYNIKPGTRTVNYEDQRWFTSLFAEGYFSPYHIVKNDISNKFMVVNTTAGIQIGRIDKSVPWLAGVSLSYNTMLINESDQYFNSFKNCVGDETYKGRDYHGWGLKFLFQFPAFLKSQTAKGFINIYVDIRQYYAMDKSYMNDKLTKMPILLIGGSYDIAWNLGRKKTSSSANTSPIPYHD